MFLWFFSILAMAAPDTAWRAMEREFVQGRQPVDVHIVNDLNQACKKGHAGSCAWLSVREQKIKNPDSARAFFSSRCEQKDHWSCVISGWLGTQVSGAMGRAHPEGPDLRGGLNDFSKACAGGERRGCLEVARMQVKGVQLKADPKAGHEKISKMCEKGYPLACAELGSGLFSQELTGGVRVAAAKLKQSCDGGSDLGCAHLGGLLIQSNDLKSALPILQSSCDSGLGLSCLELGSLYRFGLKGVKRSSDMAYRLFQRACYASVSESCDHLAQMNLNSEGRPKNLKAAAKFFELSCDALSPLGCKSLSSAYERGSGVAKNPKKAQEYRGRACHNGDPISCFELGHALESGGKGRNSDKEARKVYRKGCSFGHSASCVNLALLYSSGKGGKADNRAAVAFFSQACELGDRKGCAKLGLHMLEGKGLPSEPLKALSLLDIACKSGEKIACQQLRGEGLKRAKALCGKGDVQGCHAFARFSPHQSPEEFREASNAAEKACDSGIQLSCVKLGFLLIQEDKEEPSEKKLSRAISLFKTACQKGIGQGCFSLGLAHLEGKGTAQNVDKGAQLMAKACRNKDFRGCAKAAVFLRRGNRIAEAKAVLEIGCKSDDPESCAQLAFVLSNETPPKFNRAADLFSAACTRGHVHSCFNYAIMLHKGQGVAPQPAKAAMLLKESCRLGVKAACQAIGE